MDLGYCKLTALAAIAHQGAFFVSRLRQAAAVYLTETTADALALAP
jgi:hypothetical protein